MDGFTAKIGVRPASGWLSTRVIEEFARYKGDLSMPKNMIVVAQESVLRGDWVVLKQIVGTVGARRIRKWAEGE
ncbi:MAG: hypothetical protein ACPGJO_07990 [bacterium]